MSDTEQLHKEKPSDWKRDPIWHWRNWLLAFVGIAITLAIFLYEYFHREVKGLTSDVIAVGSLVSVQDDINKRVQVMFDNKPVPNAKFAVIKVTNVGNVAIEKAAFERPLTLHFGAAGTSKILTAQILSAYPNNIRATYKVVGNTVTLDPLLLNSGDNITLRAIYTGEDDSVTPDARIVGVSSVTGTNPALQEKAIAQAKFEGTILGIVTDFAMGAFIAWAILTYYDRTLKRKMRGDPTFLMAYVTKEKTGFIPLSDEYFSKLRQIQRVLSEEASNKKGQQE